MRKKRAADEDDLFAGIIVAEETPQVVSAPPEAVVVGGEVPLSELLPEDFNLQLLLTFIPDVKLKQRVVDLAEHALSIDVTTETGLQEADQAIADLRAAIKSVVQCFEVPCDLSNRLHKRMTGLRADFTGTGEETVAVVAARILAENRRRDAEAEAERRARQEAADAELRQQLQEEADAAAKSGAPPAVVEELKQSAATASAQPVGIARRGLSRNTAAANWKAQPVGTASGDEVNPTIAGATPAQREGIRLLMLECAQGRQPMTFFEVAWPRLNDRARAEQKTLEVPGVEAVDVGSLRTKRR